jgi:formylglycine-generating enzyme required for sulfatase activity
VGAYRRFAEVTGAPMPDEPVLGERKLNPRWGDSEQPMVMVTWEEAKAYCESWAKGRLPTEAEWEYAARSGTAGARYGDLEAIAWYADNSGSQRLDSARAWKKDAAENWEKYTKILEKNGNRIHRVKEKQPNPWGLYDILGNVWEWVADWFEEGYYGTLPPGAADPKRPSSGTYRVLRGGSWYNYPSYVRASLRYRNVPGKRLRNIGFRCAREVIP